MKPDKIWEPKPYPDYVMAAIRLFVEHWPRAEFGPGHSVLSDYNLKMGDLHFCLELINEGRYDAKDHPQDKIEATEAFLEYLRSIPEAVRMEVGE